LNDDKIFVYYKIYNNLTNYPVAKNSKILIISNFFLHNNALET